MEMPYSALLRVAWQLWWRHGTLVLLMAAVLLVPFALAGLRYPILWEAMAASDVSKPSFVIAGYLITNLLVCYPMAVRWMLRSTGRPGLAIPGGTAPAELSPSEHDRRVFVLAWRVFWIPFLWDCANLALGCGMAWGWPQHPKLPVALAIIAFNTVLVNLLAMLPLNVRWANGSLILESDGSLRPQG